MSTPTIWGQSKDMAIFETKINKASEINEIRLPIWKSFQEEMILMSVSPKVGAS